MGRQKGSTKENTKLIEKRVLELVLEGYHASEIVGIIQEEIIGIGVRQVYKYIEKASKFTAKKLEKSKERILARHVALRQKACSRVLRKLEEIEELDIPPIDKTELWVKVEKLLTDKLADLGKVEGVYIERHEHSGKDGEAININWSNG